MEKYVKAVLYAYPVLLTVEEDYGQHIENMAVLSYRSDKSAETLAERIADEIVMKNRLLWLKGVVEGALETLTDAEKTLVAIRYFGKERKIKRPTPMGKDRAFQPWSESRYFRMQARLLKKVGERLALKGLTKAEFERSFAKTELFEKIFACLSRRQEGVMSEREKRWLGVE